MTDDENLQAIIGNIDAGVRDGLAKAKASLATGEAWSDIVAACRNGNAHSINVAGATRRAAILAVADVMDGLVTDLAKAKGAE